MKPLNYYKFIRNAKKILKLAQQFKKLISLYKKTSTSFNTNTKMPNKSTKNNYRNIHYKTHKNIHTNICRNISISCLSHPYSYNSFAIKFLQKRFLNNNSKPNQKPPGNNKIKNQKDTKNKSDKPTNKNNNKDKKDNKDNKDNKNNKNNNKEEENDEELIMRMVFKMRNMNKNEKQRGVRSTGFGKIPGIIFLLIILMVFEKKLENLVMSMPSLLNLEEVGLPRLVDEYIIPGKVKNIVIKDGTAFAYTNGNESNLFVNLGGIREPETYLEGMQKKAGIKIINYVPIHHHLSKKFDLAATLRFVSMLSFLGMILAIVRYIPQINKKLKFGGPMASMWAKKTAIPQKKIATRLSDVAGLKNAKMEVAEIAEFLKDSERFTRLGARVPRGALLVGPPGTGKTLIARAIAGETSCNFFTASGSEFLEMFVGMGSLRVRRLFEKARKSVPAIIFIDEIDALGGKRNGGYSDDERERTLNQLLVEMDGFTESDNVIVLAGTNRVDMLDKALLRPGRFDRRINIDLPDIEERKEIFKVHLKPIVLKETVDRESIAGRLAALTPGFSGADIANVCNEGAIQAARENRAAVLAADLEAAFDRVIAGIKKTGSPLSGSERRLVAHHEAGHAVAGWFLPHADPLLKVTITPRTGGALGFAQMLPKDLPMYTKEQIEELICVALGGRIAEKIFFQKVSTGAANDLEKVTALAYKAVKELGMSAKVGHLGFPEREELEQRLYSDELAALMDAEAKGIVDAAFARTEKLLAEKKELVAKLAEALLEKETLVHDELVAILGERPHQTFQYKEYLKNVAKSAEE